MADIVFRSVTKRFGDAVALEGVSCELAPGRVTALLGTNGAGKSTLLRVLVGLVTPTSGSATIDGRPYRQLRDPTRMVGVALEGVGFHPGRSGRDHLRILARASSLRESRVDEVLGLLELSDVSSRPVGAYSFGMRQRLALAGGLLAEPTVLVLDEPANGFDARGIRWFTRFLRDFAERGNTALVSSHALGEVAQIADDVIVLDHGRLLVHSAVRELTSGDVGLEESFFALIDREPGPPT